MNRFTLHPNQSGAFEQRWQERDSLLRDVPGFIKFRLLRLDGTHYCSYVEWESEAAFHEWTTSEAFRKAHGRTMPEGVIAGPPQLECWEVVLDGA